MKHETSFLTRCLALAMALVLLVSNANLGVAMRAFAVEGDVSVTAGELIADNYALTDAEKELLKSGYLAGDVSYTYTVPGASDNLVNVNTDEKTITAAAYEDWIPTSAQVVVGEDVKETIELVDGVASYDYDGNAFSVKVTYELSYTISEDTQTSLLNAGFELKQGIAYTDAVSAQISNLYILEQAMPELVNLADNGFDTGTVLGKVTLADAGKEAIYALDAQMSANDGKLNLSTMIDEYDNSAKTSYLLNKGAAMHDEVVVTVGHVSNITEALNTLSNYLQMMVDLGWVEAATANQLNILANSASTLETALTPVSEAEWVAAGKGVAMVSETVDYAELDTLVAALGEQTAVTVVNPLLVDTAVVQANLSMFDVTVRVALNVVGEDNTVVEYGSQKQVLTLAEGVTAEQIAAEAEDIEAAVIAAWGDAFQDAYYTAVYSQLPDTLTADIEYTITYNPNEYVISFSGDDYAAGEEMTVPYGYVLTLEPHANEAKSYDYTVNGTAMAQGDTYTVVGDTTVSRAVGKAYVFGDLYTIIGDNYGNEKVQAILSSGALLGNEEVNVRYPDSDDANTLLTLAGDVLTASSYASSYHGLSWVPYSYGATGTENLFNGATSVAWTENEVNVVYRLVLDTPVTTVADTLALAVTLTEEAAAQKTQLDRLSNPSGSIYPNMSSLNKTMLGSMAGAIESSTLHSDPEKDAELKAYFLDVVGKIQTECLDSNNNLKLYNMLTNYNDSNNGGLAYYYGNSAEFLAELNKISGYLNDLLADDEKVAALTTLLEAVNYGQYVEKISGLKDAMAQIQEDLTAPNAAIDVTSSNLSALIDALLLDGEASYETAAEAYLDSNALMQVTDDMAKVTVVIQRLDANGNPVKTDNVTRSFAINYVITAADVTDIVDEFNTKVASVVGDTAYYNYAVAGSDINSMAGTTVTDDISSTYSYTAKTYTVKIDGEADQTITVEGLTVTLPAHPDAPATKWVYNVDGKEITVGSNDGSVSFTKEQLIDLFADGSYTITRTESFVAVENLEALIAKLNEELGREAFVLEGSAPAYTGIVGNITTDELMTFAMAMVESGYGYVGLNNEGFLYMVTNDQGVEVTEICLQTLVNAILNDESFTNQTLIDLGNNGGGKLMSTTMQLGDSADELEQDLSFVMNLSSVPSQMATVANGLESVKGWITFKAVDGVLEFDLNLPEKVYEVYLTALLATGNVDKTDVNAVDNEIAIMFLYDYIDLIINSDATTTTYTNTLAMLGYSYDLTGYEGTYQTIKDAFLSGVVVNSVENDSLVDVAITAPGQTSIEKLLGILNVSNVNETMLGMIKEYKAGGQININLDLELVNVPTNYEALVLDINHSGDSTLDTYAGKFDYTSNLPARVGTISGDAVVILLGNVDGDLNFGSGRTILDLNGYAVNGNVSSAGSVYILDSMMATETTGTVTGSVSGAVVLAGYYPSDVSGLLKDGYTQESGYVRNALFTVESDANGNVTYVIDTDVINANIGSYQTFAKALAVDVVVDLALNYYTAAALTAESNMVYGVDLDDLVALLNSDSASSDLLNKILKSVHLPETADFINIILEDLLDFGAIESAITAGEPIATYELVTAPWMIEVEHITDGDYITAGLTYNNDLAETFTLSLMIDGAYTDEAAKVMGILDEVVADSTYIKLIDVQDLTYADKNFNLTGGVDAYLEADLSDYTTLMAIVLANGTSDSAKKDALVAAVNAGNSAALKDAIDAMSVKDVFDALKVLNRGDDFATLASNVGITVDVNTNEDLEAILVIALSAAGKALEELDITGNGAVLGNLDKDDDGVYEYSYENNTSGNVSYNGYGVNYNVTTAKLGLKITLFEEVTCMWGDANHDNVVDGTDASLILQYLVGLAPDNFCTIRTDVNADGAIDGTDASLVLEYVVGIITVFPAELTE